MTLFCLSTDGLDQHWVTGRRRVLTQIAADRPALAPLLELILGLTETDPAQRLSLEHASEFLSSAVPLNLPPVRRAGLLPADGLDRLLADGLRHLREGMTPQETSLWRGPAGQRYDPCDAWRGASGVLATLTRAALDETVAQAAAWVEGRLDDVPRILPGLCFGRAGTAWALFDAGQLLNDGGLMSRAVDLAKGLPTQGPNSDVAHGLAGAGLGLLWLWQRTGDQSLRRAAFDCAESLLSSAERRGDDWFWPGPAANAYGFAHGVAGIGMFLLAASGPAGMLLGDERYLEAALGAGDTLLRGADRWRVADGPHLQWCNGPAGIGTFLIRLWAATGEQRFADAAVQCAPPAADDWAMSVGACCGLSGSGHFLLDLADFTGDDRFRTRAEAIAGVIHAQASTVDGRLVVGRPDAGHAYAEGTAGVLDFLLRLRDGGPRPWLPDQAAALQTPARTADQAAARAPDQATAHATDQAGPLPPALAGGVANDILEEVNTG